MSNNEQLAAFGQLSVEKCADLAQVELFGDIIIFWAILGYFKVNHTGCGGSSSRTETGFVW